MRHITDGELHIYLDGALDLLPEERGEEIRRHLESCQACKERLQDEQAVRARSQSILDGAVPKEVEIPPFEELRARAENGQAARDRQLPGEASPGPYRGPLRGVPLAWAATVVLAMGVGWMGGEAWRNGREPDFPDAYFPPTMAETASEVSEEGVEAEVPLGGVSAPEASRRSNKGVEELRTLAQENSLSVPGLPVLSVEWEDWVPGERALHIRQLLNPTDTLELRYLGLLMGTGMEGAGREGEPGYSPDAGKSELSPSPTVMEVSLPPGWNQVVMKKGRGWLVARAPLTKASLQALVRYIH